MSLNTTMVLVGLTFADGTSTTASATVTGLTNGTAYIQSFGYKCCGYRFTLRYDFDKHLYVAVSGGGGGNGAVGLMYLGNKVQECAAQFIFLQLIILYRIVQHFTKMSQNNAKLNSSLKYRYGRHFEIKNLKQKSPLIEIYGPMTKKQ